MTQIIDSRTLQQTLDKCLTVHDLCEMFGVSSMTIHTWRTTRGLPTITVKGGPRDNVRNAIRFHPDDVAAWAKREQLKPKQLKARLRIKVAA